VAAQDVHVSVHHRSARVGKASAFVQFASGCLVGRSVLSAAFLALGICGLLILNLAVNIGLNRWHRWFFDMLERRQVADLLPAAASLIGLVLAGAAFAVAMVWCRMTLQVEWRQQVTNRLIGLWTARRRELGPEFLTGNHGSPEYRLVEEVRFALDPIVDLSIGLANAAILGAAFVSVLVTVGGSYSFEAFGWRLTVPAYLAIAAIVYSAVVSGAMYRIGRPLIRRVAEKNEAEAQFLFKLTREAGENVGGAVSANANAEFDTSTAAFLSVVRRWHRVIREHCRLTWVTNSHSFFAPVLPLLLVTPKYVSGELSLGAVMQLAAAFTIVLGAFNWFTDNYIRFAEWSASARRVDELRRALL
jgi:vitamin B12/bleomycin/antimicrobial peptide transport system ATP-binding/permease protein